MNEKHKARTLRAIQVARLALQDLEEVARDDGQTEGLVGQKVAIIGESPSELIAPRPQESDSVQTPFMPSDFSQLWKRVAELKVQLEDARGELKVEREKSGALQVELKEALTSLERTKAQLDIAEERAESAEHERELAQEKIRHLEKMRVSSERTLQPGEVTAKASGEEKAKSDSAHRRAIIDARQALEAYDPVRSNFPFEATAVYAGLRRAHGAKLWEWAVGMARAEAQLQEPPPFGDISTEGESADSGEQEGSD